MKQEVITRPPPPKEMIDHFIRYLVMRIERLKPGENPPPPEWREWLMSISRAMVEAETVKIEILGRSEMQRFLSIDELEW